MTENQRAVEGAFSILSNQFERRKRAETLKNFDAIISDVSGRLEWFADTRKAFLKRQAEILADEKFNVEHKRKAISEIHRQTQQAVIEKRRELTAHLEGIRRELYGAAFAPGSSNILSFRDATDRIENTKDKEKTLQDARAIGDEILEKAVLKHLYDSGRADYITNNYDGDLSDAIYALSRFDGWYGRSDTKLQLNTATHLPEPKRI